MVDSSKRRSLKSIGGIMAMPMVGAAAMPAVSHAKSVDAQTFKQISGNEELSISLELGSNPKMLVTNNSKSMTILRSVHPGVVHAGDTSYDLNHSLMSSSYALRPGGTRAIPITEAIGPVAEPNKLSKRSMKLAAISSDNTHGRVLNSRVFFV